MPTIDAVVTIDGFEAYTDGTSGAVALPAIDTFKVGVGGFKVEALGNVPRDPDPNLSDLDILENPGRYVVPPTPTFQKAVVGFTKTFGPDGFPRLAVDCTLAVGEFNFDGVGNPDIYEIGLFAGAIMIAYGTFPKQTKAGNAIPLTVSLRFGGQ
jgi:hypothetical protein